jgi:hypothetical protein
MSNPFSSKKFHVRLHILREKEQIERDKEREKERKREKERERAQSRIFKSQRPTENDWPLQQQIIKIKITKD